MNYHTGVHVHPAGLDGEAWDRLLAMQAHPVPFMRHRYLSALIDSKSACPHSGWTPVWFSVHQGTELVAAAVAWIKTHSFGEYVFDWGWAEAYSRHGLRYYPKLTLSIPFTPVQSSKLLALHESSRKRLIQLIREWCAENSFSSAHLLFLSTEDIQAARADGWLVRSGVQFHWHNRVPAPFLNFQEFLSSLHRDKRKKIQQDRRKVASAGVTFRVLRGLEITSGDWDFFYLCYLRTYAEHHSSPYLTRDFFEVAARISSENWLLFIAVLEGRYIAASLLAIDSVRKIAWGRYWGATESIDCLHFEACYYQPLEWCIRNGFNTFEGGAQGEHKMARGLLPSATFSAHWLAHPIFSQAIDEFLHHETKGIDQYMNELHDRSPFKSSSKKPDSD